MTTYDLNKIKQLEPYEKAIKVNNPFELYELLNEMKDDGGFIYSSGNPLQTVLLSDADKAFTIYETGDPIDSVYIKPWTHPEYPELTAIMVSSYNLEQLHETNLNDYLL